MTLNIVLHITVGLLAAGGLLSLFLGQKEALSNTLAYTCSALAALSGGILALNLLITGKTLTMVLPRVVPFTELTLRVDSLTAFFIFVISIVTLAVSIYSIGYGREYFGKNNIGYLGCMFNFFIITMLVVVAANNILLFLFAWEMMSLVSFLLVMFEHKYAQVRSAGFVYVVMTHIGTLFLVLGFLLLYKQAGSFEFDKLALGAKGLAPVMKNLVFLAMLIGFGTKAGAVPLHIWLPRAHPAAPSHVSALMSGIMIKTAIYGLVRVVFGVLGAGPVWWGVLVLVLGCVSALLGIMYALLERDLKRLLAFSSVENVGIVLLGLGAAMIFAGTGKPVLATVALTAGLFHVFNHAIFKGLLFLGAGAIHMATHTRDVERMGGLIKKMPWTALFFLIGSISISALPPFNGFVSEWLTFQALLSLGFELPDTTVNILAPVAGAGLALTGALAAACFVKAFGISFLALPRSKNAEQAREVALSMRLGMALLAVCCLVLGVFPAMVFRLLDGIGRSLTGAGVYANLTGGGWLTVVSMPAGSASMAPPALGLALILAVPAVLLMARLIGGRTAKRVDETWNCGTNLTPAMEYTATSFSKPIRIIFRLIFQPSRDIRRVPRGRLPYFTRSISYKGRIKPVFEDFLYRPTTRMALYLADKIRALQSGSIHTYLTYIFVTMVVLLLFAR